MKYSEAGHAAAPPPHPRHAEIARTQSGLFLAADDPALTGPACQQLYRQHCLAAAMLAAGLADTATLAFIAPAHNQLAHGAAATYTHQLTDPHAGSIPFVPLTLEHAFTALAAAGLPAHAAALHRRYTDWWLLDGELDLVAAAAPKSVPVPRPSNRAPLSTHAPPAGPAEQTSPAGERSPPRREPRPTPAATSAAARPGAPPFMPTTTAAPPAGDLHARVASTILAQLETADPASWSPPWHGADPMPRNARTGRRYRSINVLALWCAAQAHGYTQARWATYRQWAALGAQVRGGERATLVLFYKELPRGADAEPADGAPFVARAAHVFNVAQVDAAPPPPPADAPTPAPGAVTPDPLPAFDAFVAATGAAIRHEGARACYVLATDTIHLPPRAAFRTPTGYAGTLAHELVHWTGAPHRLARDLTGRFGARAYAAEELVAELGAAFVLADLGLARTPHPDHAAYCASWAPLLRTDPRALSTAATQASRAADHLAALQPGDAARTGPGGAGHSLFIPAPEAAPLALYRTPVAAGFSLERAS